MTWTSAGDFGRGGGRWATTRRPWSGTTAATRCGRTGGSRSDTAGRRRSSRENGPRSTTARGTRPGPAGSTGRACWGRCGGDADGSITASGAWPRSAPVRAPAQRARQPAAHTRMLLERPRPRLPGGTGNPLDTAVPPPRRSRGRGPHADGVRGPRCRPTTRAFPGLAPTVAHGARGGADLRQPRSRSDPRRGTDRRSGPRPGRVVGRAAGRRRVRCRHRRRRRGGRPSGRGAIVTAGSTALYRRLLQQARPYWLHLAGVFGLGLLASPVVLLTPVPIKIVVDSVLGGHPLPAFLRPLFPVAAGQSPAAILLFAIALLVAVAAIGETQALASTLLRSWVGERLVLDFRARLVEQVQRLSLSYHDSRGTADALYRIQQDSPAIQYVTVECVIPALAAAVTLVTMLAVTARLDWQLALVALAISPPLFFLSRFYRPRMRSQSRHAKKLESSAAAVLQETLRALRVVKAFGQETRETDRFLGRSREGMAARVRLALLQGRYGLFVGLITALGTAAVLVIGVRHVRSGALTLGQLLIVTGYVGQLYEPLKTIGRKASGLQSYLASAERAFALLDERPDVLERPHARPLVRAAGAVAFRRVCFGYDGAHPILRDITFELEAGTRVAIVGATGAGKTTLVSLLTRFYDPTAGAILLDGVDLRDYRLADLRNQFAIVLQEPVLFSTSIAENI